MSDAVSQSDTKNNAENITSYAGLFILSLATLLFEINLTRLFSVTQYYHFAFLIIGFAMFGFGASGTYFALFPPKGKRNTSSWMAAFSLGFSGMCIIGYLLMVFAPFDSFSIAWDWRQAVLLVVHCLVLSLPFFCSGAVLNLFFSRRTAFIGRVYGVNLFGSAAGCMAALVLPGYLGGDGVIWICAFLGAVAVMLLLNGQHPTTMNHILRLSAILTGLGCAGLSLYRPSVLSPTLSPYKGLSYALQYPDAETIFQKWNSYSRVDVVSSTAIRSLPGLSYRYQGSVPEQDALFVDGDGLSGIIRTKANDEAHLAFTQYLPSTLAYMLRPHGKVLILGPQGGLEVWTALAQDRSAITVAETNPLIVEANPALYQRHEVKVVFEDARSVARGCSAAYDIISAPLTAPYRPIRSGAYSLLEDYHQTVQAYQDYVECLTPDGLLVMTTWLQTPPSESLRTFATAVTALESAHYRAADHIVAFRGYNTMTFLIARTPFSSADLQRMRIFAKERAYDIVYAPDLTPSEINLHNILKEEVYYENFISFLQVENRQQWFKQYPFDVKPATDSHPFAGHYFKLSQTRQIMAELGKSWQPFGGAGYFVIILLLVLSLGAAAILIWIPGLSTNASGRLSARQRSGLLTYSLLGLGFMLIEIPLTQRFILYLAHPAYAMTAVLFALLSASGLGSYLAHKGILSKTLGWIVVIGILTAGGFEVVFQATLRYPVWLKALITAVLLFPLGLLMGCPFSQGMRTYHLVTPRDTAYAWGVNGASSVVASVLAAYLSLATNFHIVYAIGLGCYGTAWIVAKLAGSTLTNGAQSASINKM